MGLNAVRQEGKFEDDYYYSLADKYGILMLPGKNKKNYFSKLIFFFLLIFFFFLGFCCKQNFGTF